MSPLHNRPVTELALNMVTPLVRDHVCDTEVAYFAVDCLQESREQIHRLVAFAPERVLERARNRLRVARFSNFLRGVDQHELRRAIRLVPAVERGGPEASDVAC